MRFEVQFKQTNQKLSVGSTFKDLQKVIERPDVELYTGNYEVTPKTETQTLETKDRFMVDDVTVKSIPYFEMDNNKGTTVFIGNEV